MIPLLATILFVSQGYQETYAQEEGLFPNWFNNNLEWYLDPVLNTILQYVELMV